MCVQSEAFGCAQVLWEMGASIDLVTRSNHTILEICIIAGKLESVKWLLEHGARLRHGIRPLDTLVYRTDTADPVPIVRALIQAGESVESLAGKV
jgi:ankyrin repeat protein